MEFSKRLELFGPEIFAALNDRKVALEAEGRTLYNLSVGTPDFPTPPHIKQALVEAAAKDENWKYSLRALPGEDVSDIARSFGGGGHALASGCTIAGPYADSSRAMMNAMEKKLLK